MWFFYSDKKIDLKSIKSLELIRFERTPTQLDELAVIWVDTLSGKLTKKRKKCGQTWEDWDKQEG